MMQFSITLVQIALSTITQHYEIGKKYHRNMSYAPGTVYFSELIELSS